MAGFETRAAIHSPMKGNLPGRFVGGLGEEGVASGWILDRNEQTKTDFYSFPPPAICLDNSQ